MDEQDAKRARELVDRLDSMYVDIKTRLFREPVNVLDPAEIDEIAGKLRFLELDSSGLDLHAALERLQELVRNGKPSKQGTRVEVAHWAFSTAIDDIRVLLPQKLSELESETIRLKDGTEIVVRRFEDPESGAISHEIPPIHDLSPEARREAMDLLREARVRARGG